MRASEAFRLGIMRIPATSGSNKGLVFGRDKDGNVCAACAVGTLAYAVNLTKGCIYGDTVNGRGPLVKMVPILMRSERHPLISDKTYEIIGRDTVATTMGLLYESNRMTREQIADWLEEIELKAGQEQFQQAVEEPVYATV